MKTRYATWAAAFLAFATIHALAATLYVDLNSTNPVSPYINWSTAATNIQDAIDASTNGDLILVTNGVYATGGRTVNGYALTNRVVIDKTIMVESVNGPAETTIEGNPVIGTNAVRCVYMTNNATLTGFAITDGATRSTGDAMHEQSGGGIFCESNDDFILDCVLTNNVAQNSAGGIYQGTLTNCILQYNSCGSFNVGVGGGAWDSVLVDCTVSGNSAGHLGGAAYGSTLDNCTLDGNNAVIGGATHTCIVRDCILADNSGAANGGGAYGSSLTNCLVISNSVSCPYCIGFNAGVGGGASSCTLENCTIVGNYANWYAGGVDSASQVNNCIVYYNTSASAADANYQSGMILNHCCTTPLPDGAGNITNTPLFINFTGDFHLQSNSPCINVGNNAYIDFTNDLDGDPRIVGGVVDMGAYEYQTPVSLTATIQVDNTNVATGFPLLFQAVIGRGDASIISWDFGDGTIVTNESSVSHTWMSPGTYAVTLMISNDFTPGGVSATKTVSVVTQPVSYVNVNNPNPVPPYFSWNTAATNIQDAVNASYDGGAILVTNGIYRAGSAVTTDGTTNRVVVLHPVTIESVNGPAVTLIDGSQIMRCAYLTKGAILADFTLMGGNAGTGGGVYCESTNDGVVSNCVISACSASSQGGGAYQGDLVRCTLTNNFCGSDGGGAASSLLSFCTLTGNYAANGGGAYSGLLENCFVIGNTSTSGTGGGGGVYSSTVLNSVITGNSTTNNDNQPRFYGGYGGGAYNSVLVNCTITENHASIGGGVENSALTNCIVYDNTYFSNLFGIGPTTISNYYGGTFDHCCTMPLPSGTGDITNDPLLASISHISVVSPCRGAGNAAAISGVDIDGEPWAGPPSIGCDEIYPGNVTGDVSVAIVVTYTNMAPGYPDAFRADISGPITSSKWNFGDGSVVTNKAYATHTWATIGDYPVVLTAYSDTYTDGISTTDIIHVAVPKVLYVSIASRNPVAPYDTWAKAATNIQDAVDAATDGDLILVTNDDSVYYSSADPNGWRTNYVAVYQFGGRPIYGSLTNRVAIDKPVTVESVNGPALTFIEGVSPGNDPGRCVYMTNGAALIGFTLTNGLAESTSDLKQGGGGGVWCESSDVVISNCIITGCGAFAGGGVYSGTLYNCTIVTNGGYPYSSVQLGGGAYQSILHNCTLARNNANTGGGAIYSTLYDCTVVSNYGGGTYLCILTNCSLLGNSAGIYGLGGGAYGGLLDNCDLIGNSADYGGAAAGKAGVPIILNDCMIISNTATYDGGGIYASAPTYTNCIANNCTLAFNSVGQGNGGIGGGSAFAELNSCLVNSNSALPNGYGGGVEGGLLNDCILTGNLAGQGSGADGLAGTFPTLDDCTLSGNVATGGLRGGAAASYCIANNCVVYANTNLSGQITTANWVSGNLNNCCTVPMPSGNGNITNDPAFVNVAGGDFHLQSNSPCINSGDNAFVSVTNDLDGNPRIVGGTVDIGAYEYQAPASAISYAWLQQYGLPTDGSVDYADLDGTGFSVYQDWIAGLDPTNALSVLAMLPPVPTNNPAGLVVSWESVSNRTYFLQSSTNLAAQPAFSTIQSNIVGQQDMTTYMDTNAVGHGTVFYRVGMQQ